MINTFLINGVISILICGFLAINVIRQYRKNTLNRLTIYLSFIGFLYLAISIFSFFWAFERLTYNRPDFSLIFSILIGAQTIILFKSYRLLSKIRNISWFLLFYLVILFSGYVSLQYIPLQILIISFLLTLIFSINLNTLGPRYKRPMYAGIIYSALSLIFQFLIFFGTVRPYISSIVSNAMFFVFIILFIKQINQNPAEEQKLEEKEHSYFVLFARYFIYIMVITNLVLISTVGVHEFSHVVAARMQGCESRAIIYEEGLYPYTEISCTAEANKNIIALAGPIVPLIIGIILFLVGEELMRSLSLLVFGFNLLASYMDVQEVGLSSNIAFGISILGIIFLMVGLILLAKSGIKERPLTIPEEKETDSKKVLHHKTSENKVG